MDSLYMNFKKLDFPVLEPDRSSVFYCPVSKREVRFEAQNVYNPSAAVLDGKLYLIYRADDLKQDDLPEITCRQGIVWSDNGVDFHRFADPKPVVYPDNDPYKPYEWCGGIEDTHIIAGDDGKFYLNYTTWNGGLNINKGIGYDLSLLRCYMHIAVSKDLVHWEKLGAAFSDRSQNSRSGVIVSKKDENGNLRAVKVNGKYLMFYSARCYVAVSDDLVHWENLTYIDENGSVRVKCLFPNDRPGYYDANMCEAGAAALLRDNDILVFYNASNGAENSLGQAIVPLSDIATITDRLDQPFIRADKQWEKDKFWHRWCTVPTTVCNTLVYYNKAWRLYYGIGDNVIGSAYSE